MRAAVPRRLALAATLLVWAAAAPAASARRIVAVGDVHGAYDSLLSILREAGLVDRRGHWAGGDSILVQTGDFFDRGERTLEVVDLLMKLQEQAPKAGGEVVVVLGNHEVMNLLGDLRDLNPAMLKGLVDARSETRRLLVCESFVGVVRDRARRAGEEAPAAHKLRESCVQRHPLGLVEYFAALGPEGRYGRWLRRLPAIARFENVLFLHGGISPELAGTGVDGINAQVWDELRDWDEARRWLVDEGLVLPTAGISEVVALAEQVATEVPAASRIFPASIARVAAARDWLLLRTDGPFWFRGYAKWNDEEGGRQIPAILEALAARHLVVGHTPQSSRSILPRFGGGVFLIDTGMLETVYEGRPAALEIAQGGFTAIYLEERTPLPVVPPAPRSAVVAGPSTR